MPAKLWRTESVLVGRGLRNFKALALLTSQQRVGFGVVGKRFSGRIPLHRSAKTESDVAEVARTNTAMLAFDV